LAPAPANQSSGAHVAERLQATREAMCFLLAQKCRVDWVNAYVNIGFSAASLISLDYMVD